MNIPIRPAIPWPPVGPVGCGWVRANWRRRYGWGRYGAGGTSGTRGCVRTTFESVKQRFRSNCAACHPVRLTRGPSWRGEPAGRRPPMLRQYPARYRWTPRPAIRRAACSYLARFAPPRPAGWKNPPPAACHVKRRDAHDKLAETLPAFTSRRVIGRVKRVASVQG